MWDIQRTQVWSLGWEDPLKEEMATHSSILTYKIPWTEEPGRLQSTGLQRAGHDMVEPAANPGGVASGSPSSHRRAVLHNDGAALLEGN